MTNNKQSMKVYTEEQIVNATNKVFIEAITFEDVNEIVRNLTPIKLPSDDMAVIALETISKLNPKFKEKEEAFYIAGFIECAKWMRDKIGGNK
jgi:hypothetical protein